MRKKILYCLTSLAHKRVFESFEKDMRLEQLVVGPKSHITNPIVPEDYGDFVLPVINYNNFSEIQKVVNSYGPDVYVQSDLSPQQKHIKLPSSCKRVFVSHGLIGNHVAGISGRFDLSAWRGMDLYCGETKVFEEWIKSIIGVTGDHVLLGALPQLDLIYKHNYCSMYRDKVIKNVCGFVPNKVILFIGFEGKDRLDFKYHNEDFYRVAIQLEHLAIKYGWFILMKPRHYFNEMIAFLKQQKWGVKYLEDFKRLQYSKHMHIITTTGHIYRYYFADVFVMNGCSTAEIEVCCLKKPLILVRSKVVSDTYDPYGTVASEAASCVMSDCIDELENKINMVAERKEFQNRLLDEIGVRFDGNMYKRIQEQLIGG